MKIGIIGAGRVATAFARYLLTAGHEVLLSNSRGPETLSGVIEGLGVGASAVSTRQAAEAPIVLLAVPWLHIEDALKEVKGDWNERILIDATNQFIGSKGELADLKGQVSSEMVARLAPEARVVKALNNLFVERFEAGPKVGNARRITFISGDDAPAKLQVGALLIQFGFAVIDLGSLHQGGLVQQAGGPLAGLDLLRQDHA